MAATNVPIEQRYIIKKVGSPGVQGDVGPAGATGPAGTPIAITSGITHDGVERTGEMVNDLLDELLHVDIGISSFTMQIGNQEIGAVLNNVGFDWVLAKNGDSQNITGSNITQKDPAVGLRTLTIDLNGLTTNGAYTLQVIEGATSVSSQVSVLFQHKVYWGNAVDGTVDSAFILALNKELRANRLITKTFTVGAGEKAFVAFDEDYDPTDAAILLVGGFAGGFTGPSSVSFTNASGHVSTFKVYESANENLGAITLEVQ